MSDGLFHPAFKARPFWWEEAPPTTDGAGPPPARADVLVIGGGYTGLSAALALARRGTDVVVVEAEAFGWGASGRSAGHVSSGVNLGKGSSSAVRSPMEQALGPERAKALVREAAGAFDGLEAMIAGEGIACDYRRSGRYMAALTPAHYRRLEEKAAGMAEAGVRMLPRERQREALGTDLYHGGMVVERAGQLHPAKLLHGLLAACRTAGVKLSAPNRVTGWERHGSRFRVRTSQGDVLAERLLLATNGYTDRLIPWVGRRIVPAASYMIATEPLSENLAETLIPGRRTIADSKRVLSYFRRSPDGRRILFGGRATLAHVPPERAAPMLHRTMTRVFPELAQTRITHAWTGSIAFTFDFLPHLGEHEGVHFCLGCNGSGVAMQTYLGAKAALSMVGAERSPFEGLPFPTAPFYTGVPWFLPLVSRYYALRDRLDQMLG